MQALSSFPSPSSDTSNNQARAVLSKDEENMKSPVNRILIIHNNSSLFQWFSDLLLYSRGVTLVDKQTLAGGHVPLPDGGVRPSGDDVRVLHRHAVYVAGVTPEESSLSVSETIPHLFT